MKPSESDRSTGNTLRRPFAYVAGALALGGLAAFGAKISSSPNTTPPAKVVLETQAGRPTPEQIRTGNWVELVATGKDGGAAGSGAATQLAIAEGDNTQISSVLEGVYNASTNLPPAVSGGEGLVDAGAVWFDEVPGKPGKFKDPEALNGNGAVEITPLTPPRE